MEIQQKEREGRTVKGRWGSGNTRDYRVPYSRDKIVIPLLDMLNEKCKTPRGLPYECLTGITKSGRSRLSLI